MQTTNYRRIGNLKQAYSPIGGNWLVNGGISTSYNGTLAFSYGSNVENNNDRGIYIDVNAINDNLDIFIGLKNAWKDNLLW